VYPAPALTRPSLVTEKEASEQSEVVMMSMSESRPSSEPLRQSDGFRSPSGTLSVFAVGALVVTAVVAGVVVLSALASWWVLFGLFAVFPLMMLFCGAAMMTARRGPLGGGFWMAGPCASWLRDDVGRPSGLTE
jgi:Flp pilus assembly protein TadB